jgi:hypothetical protein
MLSKKQFNAATKRLQNELTTSDLISMLRHQLTQQNKDNSNTDIINQLGDLSTQFEDKRPLDRRRAENYLAKTLYGKKHSQIAHLMPKSENSVSDNEFGMKAKYYGRFIEHFTSDLSFGDDIIDAHGKELARRLRASSPDDFHISYQGYFSSVGEYGLFEQYNVLMLLAFLDLEVVIEFGFTCEFADDAQEPIEDCLIHITINNQSLDNYAKTIGYTDKGIEENDVEALFISVAFAMSYDKENPPSDFYCTQYPKETLAKHKWSLNLSREYISSYVLKTWFLVGINMSVTGGYGSNGNIKKEMEQPEEIKAVIARFRHDELEGYSVSVKGFSHDDVNYSDGQIGELIFKSNTTKDKLTISCIYDVDYDEIILTHLTMVCNKHIIYDGKANSEYGKPWHSVVTDIVKYMGYIKEMTSTKA